MEKIYAALSAIQGELAKEGISKDRKNAQQGYAFRGIDDVLNALAPLFKKYGVFCIPTVTARQVTQVETKSGGNLFYTTIEADFTFYSAEDGSKLSGRVIGEAMDSGDKSTNKAISAAMKYLCILTFCIPLEGENDADAVTHEIKPAPGKRPPQKPEVAALAPPPHLSDQALDLYHNICDTTDPEQVKVIVEGMKKVEAITPGTYTPEEIEYVKAEGRKKYLSLTKKG